MAPCALDSATKCRATGISCAVARTNSCASSACNRQGLVAARPAAALVAARYAILIQQVVAPPVADYPSRDRHRDPDPARGHHRHHAMDPKACAHRRRAMDEMACRRHGMATGRRLLLPSLAMFRRRCRTRVQLPRPQAINPMVKFRRQWISSHSQAIRFPQALRFPLGASHPQAIRRRSAPSRRRMISEGRRHRDLQVHSTSAHACFWSMPTTSPS